MKIKLTAIRVLGVFVSAVVPFSACADTQIFSAQNASGTMNVTGFDGNATVSLQVSAYQNADRTPSVSTTSPPGASVNGYYFDPINNACYFGYGSIVGDNLKFDYRADKVATRSVTASGTIQMYWYGQPYLCPNSAPDPIVDNISFNMDLSATSSSTIAQSGTTRYQYGTAYRTNSRYETNFGPATAKNSYITSSAFPSFGVIQANSNSSDSNVAWQKVFSVEITR